MRKTKLYAAYGSNLNLSQMSRRCPLAKVVGVGMLKGYKLTFRSVATIEKDKTAETPVGVWEITPTCEMALDRYEGYPHLYRKEEIDVLLKGERTKAMVYIMNNGEPQMPNRYYLETIAEGYDDVGIDTVYLSQALQDTHSRVK